MRWCVIRHPDLGVAVVAEGSLSAHEPRGWVRTSPLVDDQYSLNPADHPLPESQPESVVVEQSTDSTAEVAVNPTGGDTETATPRTATKTRRSTED